MYFHEIAEELKIYMAPSERGGIFVVQLIGDTLRAPMTEEEEKMALDDKFNPLANGMSLNMQDQIFEGKKFISRNRAGLICSRYDGADFAEEIDNLYDADKDHLQMFLAKKGYFSCNRGTWICNARYNESNFSWIIEGYS